MDRAKINSSNYAKINQQSLVVENKLTTTGCRSGYIRNCWHAPQGRESWRTTTVTLCLFSTCLSSEIQNISLNKLCRSFVLLGAFAFCWSLSLRAVTCITSQQLGLSRVPKGLSPDSLAYCFCLSLWRCLDAELMTFADKFLLISIPKSFFGGWQRDYNVARVGSEERRAVSRWSSVWHWVRSLHVPTKSKKRFKDQQRSTKQWRKSSKRTNCDTNIDKSQVVCLASEWTHST